MRQMADTWAVILAGGEGSRLHKFTRSPEGLVIPKQYCSVARSPCLLHDAIDRAASVALFSHVCTVVASRHRRWWARAVAELDSSNVFIQPSNRGTAFGILLPLLSIEMRNPDATVVFLPADHYFRDEDTIARALRIAGNLACENREVTYLLGAEPVGADPELGYILPEEKVRDKPEAIVGFKEKPCAEHAQELIELGALWNLFILAGSVNALVKLFDEDYAEQVKAMRKALREQAAGGRDALEVLYKHMDSVDFSRDVLEVQAHQLQVIRVPPCGWTDLGTPKRVEATIRSLEAGTRSRSIHSAPLFLDLGARFS